MRNLKERLNPILAPLDITFTLILKLISDLHVLLKNFSALASISFVILNIKRLFVSWKPFITIALLIPALIISPSSDMVRFILSVCVLWIFFDKLKDPDKDYAAIVGWIVVVYVLAMTIGLMNPAFYVKMDTNAMRYKFITGSHNALTVTALICLVYLVNVFITLEDQRKHQLLKWATYIAILLTFLVFILIKSRIYILITFFFILLIGIKKLRQSRPLALAPVFYILIFLCLTLTGSLLSPMSKTMATDDEKKLELINNKRLFSSDGTGRITLVKAFLETFQEKGWQQFVYQNNVNAYYTKKAAIPNIDLTVSTLTENSYLVLLLYTGFLGLFVFLFIFATYLWRFFKRRELLSFSFMLLLMAAWHFEETVLFPFSMVTHLFALATVNRLETKKI